MDLKYGGNWMVAAVLDLEALDDEGAAVSRASSWRSGGRPVRSWCTVCSWSWKEVQRQLRSYVVECVAGRVYWKSSVALLAHEEQAGSRWSVSRQRRRPTVRAAAGSIGPRSVQD